MHHQHKLHLDQPALYTIQVQGRIGENWVSSFEPIALNVALDDEQHVTSTLRVAVADQAALQGLLRSLYTLGLPLLLVRWEQATQEQETDQQQ